VARPGAPVAPVSAPHEAHALHDPVVDANHVLIGIVTERDFLKFAIKALEMHD